MKYLSLLFILLITFTPAFSQKSKGFKVYVEKETKEQKKARKEREKQERRKAKEHNNQPSEPVAEKLTQPPELPDAQVLKIKEEAGKHFKQGLFYLTDNRRKEAREEFDSSIEAFLISTVDVQRNQPLRECYEQLIETIYRMEFAKNQIPQIRSLSGTCGWNIDGKLADDIAKQAQDQINDSEKTTKPILRVDENESNFNGFTKQTFQTSPLDELARPTIGERKPTFDKPKIAFVRSIATVKARTGDTIEILAKRHGANVVEVAKLNGLFVNSKLPTGREVKIPIDTPVKATTNIPTKPKIVDRSGSPPVQLKNGTVPQVMTWFNEYANDPYSLKIVRWGKLSETYVNEYKVWAVCVKFRAKNSFNAYILSSMKFYFSKGKIISANQITDCQN